MITNNANPLLVNTPTKNFVSPPFTANEPAGVGDEHEPRTVALTLRSRPSSDAAVAAIKSILLTVYKPIGRDQKAGERYVASIETIVADVLRGASYDLLRPCYRPMAAGDFIGEPIGHRPFIRAVRDLEAHDFIRRKVGKQGFKGEPGEVTRIYPTPHLTDHLFAFGIVAAECRDHFFYARYADYAKPIQLRRSSTRKNGKKIQGKPMKVDWKNPTVVKVANRMTAYNRFLSDHTITGPKEADLDDIAYYRSYNHGQRKGHDFKLGGRMYPHGRGYFLLKRSERSLIRIDGEATVEVDISACFLTLAYYLLGMQLPNPGDPYAGTDLPRPIVKGWINSTLSNYGFHKEWLGSVLEKLADDDHFDVPDKYPIEVVEAKIRTAIPVIDRWMASHFTWANLHHEESEIMLAAMESLAFEHGFASLPVHDSLRVPVSKRDLAVKAIYDSFKARTGLKPVIK